MKPAEENLSIFLSWAVSQTDANYRDLELRGQLNRTEIARECGFAKSVLLQNPRVKEGLRKIEAELRQRDILPPIAATTKSTSLGEVTNPRVAADNARLKRLEAENASLRAEVIELRGVLARYRLIDDVLSHTGRLPR